ncbi:LamG-like jellyroll fold domain-containing protein [Prosthecobacter sp.]|uniref:LamG-like jellyroll fold domain-containing protein n=1 Tax=Prosthecobacter sp. TaxID=1965333 RepID=UPI003784A24D
MKTELDSLAGVYLDGSITPQQMERLNTLLLADGEARREFAELMNVDSALAALAADWAPEEVTGKPVKATRWISASPRWIAAAAACVSFLLGAWFWQEAHRAYAVVGRAAGVVELVDGASVRGESHDIRAGSVSLITARGARLVIEAPAEFRFESAQRLHMKRGRLAADVPPGAKGFTVITPTGDAVDLGTRFGVDVASSGAAEVHVFQGEVITKAAGARANQSLHGGDAVSFDQGASTARELRSSAFIQPDEMPGLTAGLAAGQRAQSEAALSALRKDPALIALLDFEAPEELPGVYRTVQGRWPGSHAPEFVNVGDHLKLDVGGGRDWPQLTLAAWVRIDRLGAAAYQSLLHTDGWSKNNPGQVHWIINRNSTMRLALIGDTLAPGSTELQGYPDSRSPVLPEQGRWVHLAAVYDATRASVRFYLNGQFDKETRLETAYPARLGPAQIGNWNQQDRKLSGRVDELLLLGRAMSDAEIQALHAAGNPYR